MGGQKDLMDGQMGGLIDLMDGQMGGQIDLMDGQMGGQIIGQVDEWIGFTVPQHNNVIQHQKYQKE